MSLLRLNSLGKSNVRRTRHPRRRLCPEQLELRNLLAAEIIFTAETGLITVSGSSGADRVLVQNEADLVTVTLTSAGTRKTSSVAAALVARIEFSGLEGNDDFENRTSIASQADGGPGNDRLTGGEGVDQLLGRMGRDTLSGLGGDDLIHGGDNADILLGGDGHDQLFGQGGDDKLRGGPGDDRLRGDGGYDIVLGELGDDSLLGGTERDLLIGGWGGDSLDGQDSGDLLVGSQTSHDESDSALTSVLQSWRSGLSYADRVAAISTSSTTPLVLEQTVQDDGTRDNVIGGGGSDWYFLTGHFDEHDAAFNLSSFLGSIDTISPLDEGETVSSRLPHGNDTARRTEHLAMFELVALRNVTHSAVASGAWSDPAVWLNRAIPSEDANVSIAHGVEVTVDRQISQRLHTVRVEGTLRFSSSANSELLVDTLVVTPSGKLEMGTEDQPIAPDVTARLKIVDNGPIDRDWDPLELSRGAIVHGTASFHGAAKTPYGVLSGRARVGDRTIELKDAPTNWRVGDQLVLAGTDRAGKQSEVIEISSISGRLIGLTRALRYSHASPGEKMSVHVANLTRNAVVESENVDAVRGHLMFMHSDSAHVNYLAVRNMGRTDKQVPANDTILNEQFKVQPDTGLNQRGRYAMHFHRSGGHDDGQAAEVYGSVVTGSRGWGFVNHSSFVEFTSNVAYDVNGAAFVTETGDEIGRFDRNLAIFSRGSGQGVEERNEIEDFGHQGDGFWFQGGGVSVTNNVAVGQAGNGFIFFTRALREGGANRVRFAAENLVDSSIANGQASVSVGEVPLREFRGNEAYGNATGTATRFHKLGNTHQQMSVIEDLTLWNNARGLHLPYTNRVVVRNVQIIGNPGNPTGNGITRNDVTRNVVYENITVEGYEVGVQIPERGNNVVVSGQLKNIVNVLVTTPLTERAVQIMSDVQFEQPTNLRGKKPYDVSLRANFSPHAESVDHVFLNDRILWYGPDGVRQLYFAEQVPSFVPFPEGGEYIPAEYVGKTNEQLWQEFQKVVGGAFAPANAIRVANIQGLVTPLLGDENSDGRVDIQDLDMLCAGVGQDGGERLRTFLEMQNTGPGDANFDHVFNSSDLIQIFQRGKYETGQPASWSDGDWDCDGTFSSSDLIAAFNGGTYKTE